MESSETNITLTLNIHVWSKIDLGEEGVCQGEKLSRWHTIRVHLHHFPSLYTFLDAKIHSEFQSILTQTGSITYEHCAS